MRSGKPLDMIAHPNNKNGTALEVFATKPVLTGLMDFVDDRLISGDLIWPVLLIPLDPLAPLFNSFLAVEFPCDRETGDGVDVGVEELALVDCGVLLVEDLLDL